MPKAELGEVSIHYEEAGSGSPVLVYCHGLGGNGESFERDDMAWYAQHFRTISWDNRGLGRSGQAAKYSLPKYAEDLNGLLDHLGVAQAVVMGVSWGGVVVQRFALDYPERCAAIVLDSTSSEVNPASAENWYMRGEVVRLGAAAALAGREMKPAFEGHVTMSDQRAVERVVPPEQIESYVAEARATAGLREHPLTPYLHRIKVPALVVGGGKDTVAGAGGSVVIARAMGDNARLEILQDAGHGVMHQARDEFRALLFEFLGQHGLQPS